MRPMYGVDVQPDVALRRRLAVDGFTRVRFDGSHRSSQVVAEADLVGGAVVAVVHAFDEFGQDRLLGGSCECRRRRASGAVGLPVPGSMPS